MPLVYWEKQIVREDFTVWWHVLFITPNRESNVHSHAASCIWHCWYKEISAIFITSVNCHVMVLYRDTMEFSDFKIIGC